MPLHGVGIIVGGTLAVLGSAYVVKKFIYDPHLSHYVEAFIAQHPILHPLSQSLSHEEISTRNVQAERVLVPISTSGTSSAREPNLTKLRRRSVRNSRDEARGTDMEMREPLLRSGERDHYLDQDGLDDWGKEKRASMGLKDRGLGETGYRPGPSNDIRVSSGSTTSDLIDLDSIHDPGQKSESVIFDYAAPAPRSRSASPAPTIKAMSLPPNPASQTVLTANQVDSVENRTTSGYQSPTPPGSSSLADSWSIEQPSHSHAAPSTSSSSHYDPLQRQNLGDTDEDDLISHPDTSASDYYIDAESYTPHTDRAFSPSPTFPAFPRNTAGPSDAIAAAEIEGAQDLSRPGYTEALPDGGPSFIRLRDPPILVGGTRSMSVISLSEMSESGSEWEAI